jgi:N4-gp56 family major capsid protein
MAMTEFGTSDAQAVKLYAKMTFREALKGTLVDKLLVNPKNPASKNNIIQRFTDLEKDAGDTIKYDLLMQTGGAGVSGGNWLKYNEEPLTYYQDSIVIQQLRQGHMFDRQSQQRTLHNLRVDARENLSDWWKNTLDDYMMRYLCGDTTINHGQAGVAPDDDHFITCGDVTHSATIATDEASLSSNDQIDLMDLDYAKEKAKTITPMVRPAKIDGGEYYVAVLHPYSMTDIRVSTNSSATIKWTDIQQYANLRGLKNPIFTGAAGIYNGIVIYDDTRIYSPIANVRRNLFLGAQAGVFAVGSAYDKIDRGTKYGNLPMSWEEDLEDYRDKKGIAAGMIFAIKACRFNSKNFGAMVMTCRANVTHN